MKHQCLRSQPRLLAVSQSRFAQLLLGPQGTSAGRGLKDLGPPKRPRQREGGPPQPLRCPARGAEPPDAPHRSPAPPARSRPHPSPTARTPRPGCPARLSALVSPSGLPTWVRRSRRHGRAGTVAAPPSVGGAAGTGWGREGGRATAQERHLTAAAATAGPKMADAQPPPGTRPQHGRGHPGTASWGEPANRDARSTGGRANDCTSESRTCELGSPPAVSLIRPSWRQTHDQVDVSEMQKTSVLLKSLLS